MKALARILLGVGLAIVIFPSSPVNKQGVQATATQKVSAAEPPQTVQEAVKPVVLPEKPLSPQQSLLEQAGIPSNEWPAASFIFHKESSWRPGAVNHIGCVGLGQSCPGGSGLKTECPDWQTNTVCQIKHFDKYAKRRYGGWSNAMAFWQQRKWW